MSETRPLARRTRARQGQNEGFRLPQPNASVVETEEAQRQKENNDVKVYNGGFVCFQQNNYTLE